MCEVFEGFVTSNLFFSDLRFLGPEYYSRYKVNRRPIFFNYSGYKPCRSCIYHGYFLFL